VTCLDVIEHMMDDNKAMMKIGSLIDDCGFLVLTVPAYMCLWSAHDVLNHHYRRYTKKELLGKLPGDLAVRKITYFNTLLLPAAILDKVLFARKKASYSLKPNKLVNKILYSIFSIEKYLLKWIDLPFGVSILLIAQKQQSGR
jgi:hypothetical protein